MRDGNFQVGDAVVATGIDDERDTVFIGNVLVPQTGGPFTYYESDAEKNIPVYAVEDRTTGKVRHYRPDFLELDLSD